MPHSRLIAGLMAGLAAGALAGCPQEPPKLHPHAILTPSPKPVPETRLVAGDGQPFSLASQQGRWVWLYFGFANCPDVCPAALDYLAAEYKRLKAPEQVQVVFVSVDPKRDTPAKLQPFTRFYHPDFVGVTGEKPAIDELAKALGAAYVVDAPAESGGGYNVSHSNLVFVVDPEGRYTATYVPAANPGDLAADFNALSARKVGS